MEKDFATSDRSRRSIIGREVLAATASVLLYPFGLGKSRRRAPRIAEQRTVVMVHGYFANRSCLMPLAAYLRARGMKMPLAYEYDGSIGIEQAAIGLKEFLRKNVGGGRIDLVCHSLGGVIARVYLQELGGARRVDQCITLGSPHRGTYNAYWLTSRVGRELRPDSALLERLAASKARATGVRFTSIVAGSDNIVIPRVYGTSHEDIVHVPGLGHLGLLFSPTVFSAVAKRLLEGREHGQNIADSSARQTS